MKQLIFLSIILLFGATQTYAQNPNVLVLFTGSMQDMQTNLLSNGVRPMHSFPSQTYSAIIGYQPTEITDSIYTNNLVSVFHEPVVLEDIEAFGDAAKYAVVAFNNFLGEPIVPSSGSTILAFPPVDDLRIPDDYATGNIGVDIEPNGGPSPTETSLFMIGSTSVTVVLPESTGAIDPETENWNATEINQVIQEVTEGTNWYLTRESRARLSFVYRFFPNLSVSYEPINHPSSQECLWINQIAQAFGYYSGSNCQTNIRNANHAIRTIDNTDWAYTIFVVDSSNDADGAFTDGMSAYAYLKGPFVVMTYDNGGWGIDNMEKVTAHEMGHSFQALDQYLAQIPTSPSCNPNNINTQCTQTSGFLNVENQNCEITNCLINQPSIMKWHNVSYLTGTIDIYARGQLGWRDQNNDNILDPIQTPYNSGSDADGDTITDYWDDCPNSFSTINWGCPLPPQPVIPISTCGTINTPGNYELTNNVSSGGTCITLTTNNVDFNCNNKEIIYATNSSLGGVGFLANASFGLQNITIRNCVITQENSVSGGISTYCGSLTGFVPNKGIRFRWVSNSVIQNNTLRIKNTNGNSVGISVEEGEHNRISENELFAVNSNIILIAVSGNNSMIQANHLSGYPNATSYRGIIVGGEHNLVTSNNVSTKLPTPLIMTNNIVNGNAACGTHHTITENIFTHVGGTETFGLNTDNIFSSNDITSLNAHGLVIANSNNTVISNTIRVSGSVPNPVGIHFITGVDFSDVPLSDNNTISDNTILVIGDANAYGLNLNVGNNQNLITNNRIMAKSISPTASSFGVYVPQSNGNRIFNNIINATQPAPYTYGTNTWNTTFTPTRNIVGGAYLGGNYYTNPNSTGYSDTCTDNNFNDICDVPLVLSTTYGGATDYLPLAKPPQLTYTGTVSPGNTITFSLREFAGSYKPYFFALAFGTSPGLLLPDGRTIPLNYDTLMLLSLNYPNTIGLSNNVGYLNNVGYANATLVIPNDPSLVGQTFYAGFVTVNNAVTQILGISPALNLTVG